jgi:hypothetical protein
LKNSALDALIPFTGGADCTSSAFRGVAAGTPK